MPLEVSFEERLRIAERHDLKAEKSKCNAWKNVVMDFMKDSPNRTKIVFDYVQAQLERVTNVPY